MCRMIGIPFSFRPFFVIQFMLAEMRHNHYSMTCMCAFTLEHTNTCKQSPNNFIQLTHPAWRVSLIAYTHQVDMPSRRDTQQELVCYTNTCGRVRGYPSTDVSVAVSVQSPCSSCIGEWDIQSMTPMLMVSPSLEVAHVNMSGHTVKYAEYT